MADKAVSELIEAERITAADLFVLEQNGTAKKLSGQVLLNWLTAAADGHGGIQSIAKAGSTGLADTYRITLADTTVFDFVVTNGRGITGIEKTATNGLVDTYTIRYNDGSSGTFAVTNGAKGEKGDSQYVWIKYASQKPTASSHSFGDVADNWIGIYSGGAAAAPTDWTQYKWFKIKGEQGPQGDAATLRSSSVDYQVGDSGYILPSGAWSESVPVVPQGKYLWTRVTNTFNTGSLVVSYSVSRMGLDGAGSVSSVANVSPDENGNVPLTAEHVGAVPSAGGAMTGALNMNGHRVQNVAAPAADGDAVNMGYLNNAVNRVLKTTVPHNRLVNSCWAEPKRIVNQRGQANYAGKNYGIDGWLGNSDASSVEITEKGLLITGTYMAQILEEEYTGQKLTICAMDEDGEIAIATCTVPEATEYQWLCTSSDDSSDKVWVGILQTDKGVLRANVSGRHGRAVVWAALYVGEYTSETLPECQPKGYAAELLACQRYLQRFRTASERKNYCEDFRPAMRMTTNGVVSTFESEIDGVTYYFASAEL